MSTFPATADLYDEHDEALESCDLPFRQYGGMSRFQGEIVTLRAHEDNLLLKGLVAEPGHGRVLVVDTDGSTRVAMIGDKMALRALENGWSGFVVNGAVRDALALSKLDIGVKALGTNPRRSRKDGTGHQGGVVSFGGASFTPGHHLVSDEDGVVVLPPAD